MTTPHQALSPFRRSITIWSKRKLPERNCKQFTGSKAFKYLCGTETAFMQPYGYHSLLKILLAYF